VLYQAIWKDAEKVGPVGLYVKKGDLYIKRIETAEPDDELVWAIPGECVLRGFTPKQAWSLRHRLTALQKEGKI